MNKFIPKSAGTLSDITAGVEISKVHGGYFSSEKNINAFIDKGIKPIINKLPKKLLYIDFGGGEGLLAKKITEYLKKKDFEVETIVIDGNWKYLEKAKDLGLKTILANVEDISTKKADLITIRSVLHYNSLNRQEEILKNIYKHLKSNGFLVTQISSGSKENCELRTDIVNLKSLGRTKTGDEYKWINEEEFLKLTNKVGFKSNLAGYAPPCSWSPEEQWNRFNSNDKNKENYLKESEEIIKKYLKMFSAKILGIRVEDKNYIINYQYPIFISSKYQSPN